MTDSTYAPSPGDLESATVADADQATPREVHDERKPAATEIRHKALSGVAMVAGRDTLVRGIALLGNIAFARLLSPSSFGIVAFGLVTLQLVLLLSDGGLGVGLIRRPEEPHVDDLRVLLGYQLVLASVLAAVVAVAATAGPFGRAGLVTAVMMIALPLMSLRAPSSIVFERSLNYGPLVRVEIVEQLTYYAWGIGAIMLGAGVWGLATASIVRALTGTAAMLSVSPIARLSPSYSWRRLKPMLGFGVKFQGVQVSNAAGYQLLNIGVAGIGGPAVLGLWTMAFRLAQVPYLLFNALWRVSFPAAAQLLAHGESARKLIERGLGLAAVGTGIILAPATGAVSPLIPAVFGHRWGPVADVLPVAFFALQVSGPVSVATAGYLYAVGDTSTVLRSAIATSVIWLLVALPLLPYIGVVAIGVGWAAAACAESVILSIPTRRRTGAEFLGPLLVPWLAASLGGFGGWLISRSVSHGLAAALIGGAAAACLYAIPMVLLRRDAVRAIGTLASRAVRPAP